MIEPPVSLLFRVQDLDVRSADAVRRRRWTDAALATAGMLQATEDALAGTSSVLDAAAAALRARGAAGARPAAAALDTALRLRALAAGARSAERRLELLAALAVEAAGLALAPEDGGARVRRADDLLRRLGEPPPGLREAVARIPSCFRAFDQHPDDVGTLTGALADRWPDRARPVVVVGVRTSGSYLAPFAVAALRQAGYRDVAMVGLRPDQRPSPAAARTLRAAGRRNALVVVVDDPPTTGAALARVCAEVLRLGVDRGSLVLALALFDELPARLTGVRSVVLPWPEWSIHHRLGAARVRRDLAAALAPATLTGLRELPVPPAPARTHARRRYAVEVTHTDGTVESRTVQVAGAGLGYFGEHDVAVAAALRGCVPAVVYAGDGVVCTEDPGEGRTGLPPASVVVDYVAARHDALPVARDLTGALRGRQPVWEVAGNHLGRAYGRFWRIARIAVVDRLARDLLRTAAPSVPDGDMRPELWSADRAGGRPLKRGFSERAFSNFDLVCVDDVFDLVGAAVHAGDVGYGQGLRAGYEKRTGRAVAPERWLLYELVHLWDLQRQARLQPPVARVRRSQALRRYLAEVLLSGTECRAEGPVVALDVDGVLETDILGFEAPTPASITCLRALHAHGFRTVLATGRCLDDAVEMADLYGLAGAAAEYGSVVYDRRAGRVTPLVPPGDLARLDGLRARLAHRPGVRVDPRHRHSVRASAVGAGGALRALAVDAPDGVRAVVGEGQTDFVAAGVDKAEGVGRLLADLGVDRPVLAVGDTGADLRLLGWAASSVVPRHGTPAAKAVATRVARSPYQAGLQNAVAGLLGHRPGSCPVCSPPPLTDDTRALLHLLRVPEGSRPRALLRTLPLLRVLRERGA